MTFVESLKNFLALCDEYAPESNISNLYTTDEDIQKKVKLLYDLAYQRVAQIKTLSKTKELSFTYTGQRGYEEVKLPSARQIKQITCLDENNIPVAGDFYYISDQKVMISKEKNIKYICEYIPTVSHINEETDNDFTFELTDDVVNVIPYLVASDLFKTDPSVNWQYFERQANEMLQQIIVSNKGISVNITEGEF